MSQQTSLAIRKPYDKHPRHILSFNKKSRAKQSERDHCDINKIMAKYQKTGLIEHVREVQGRYGDFSSMEDYQSSIQRVINAQQSFMALPSKIRARFHNDPGELLDFMSNAENRDEAVRLGLIPKPERSDVPAPGKASKGKEPDPEPQPEPKGEEGSEKSC